MRHWTTGLLLTALSITIVACTSGAPDNAANPSHLKITEKAQAWTSEYVQAMMANPGNPDCARLDRLAQDPTAPLTPLARLRGLQYCSGNAVPTAVRDLETLYDDPALRWLRPLAIEALVQLALSSGLQSTLADFALARSLDLNSQREKEQLLTAGIAAARALGRTVRASELEAELYRISPRKISAPTKSLWLKAADDFRTNEQWPDALALYDRIKNATGFTILEQLKARDGIRQVHKQKFRFNGAPLATFLASSRQVAQFAEVQLASGSANLTFDQQRALFEAWMQYPRDVWSYGDVTVAKAEVRRVLALAWPAPVFKASAYWLQARIFANYSEWTNSANAGNEATRILAGLGANSGSWTDWQWTLWDDAHWTAALAQRKLRAWSRSAELLEQGLSRTRNPNSEYKFLFWAAHGRQDAGDAAAANQEWTELAHKDPHGFYGAAAHFKLGLRLAPIPDSDLTAITRPATVTPADFSLIIWLMESEELALAQRHARQILPANGTDLDELRLRAYVHDYSTIQSIYFSRVPAADRDDFMRQHARLFYPEPFRAHVDAAVARQPRIEREYVYSVMRQESAFNALARSWAGAYGLLQMLPYVARAAQRKAGVTFTHDYELFRPSLNIPLGVAHMDQIVDDAGTGFIFRTISYNSTLAKARDWKRRFYHGNIFEFLEEIPFDETRSYVRLVMRNYLMNRRLTATQPFDFPLALLEI